MIVYKENQRFYLNPWEYNACRIMSALAEVVREHGGNVKPTIPCMVSDRHKYDVLEELKKNVKWLENRIKDAGFQVYFGKSDSETAEEFIERMNSKLESKRMEIRKCEDEINYDKPIPVTHTSYITFEMNGVYYYYQVDDNPFFEFYYVKTPITEKGYSRDACLEEDAKEWLWDCFFKSECPSEMIIKAAEFIFDMLMNAKNSHIIRDCKKTKVPNTYDSGWHYENIYAKERFGQIDF